MNARLLILMMLGFAVAACGRGGGADATRADCASTAVSSRAAVKLDSDLSSLIRSMQDSSPRHAAAMRAEDEGSMPVLETRRICSTSAAGEANCTTYECTRSDGTIRCLEYFVSAREVYGETVDVLQNGPAPLSAVTAVEQPTLQSLIPTVVSGLADPDTPSFATFTAAERSAPYGR